MSEPSREPPSIPNIPPMFNDILTPDDEDCLFCLEDIFINSETLSSDFTSSTWSDSADTNYSTIESGDSNSVHSTAELSVFQDYLTQQDVLQIETVKETIEFNTSLDDCIEVTVFWTQQGLKYI